MNAHPGHEPASGALEEDDAAVAASPSGHAAADAGRQDPVSDDGDRELPDERYATYEPL